MQNISAYCNLSEKSSIRGPLIRIISTFCLFIRTRGLTYSGILCLAISFFLHSSTIFFVFFRCSAETLLAFWSTYVVRIFTLLLSLQSLLVCIPPSFTKVNFFVSCICVNDMLRSFWELCTLIFKIVFHSRSSDHTGISPRPMNPYVDLQCLIFTSDWQVVTRTLAWTNFEVQNTR